MKKEPLINVKLEKGIEKEINEAMDINILQANTFHTKMMIKEIDLRDYLYNKDINDLPPKKRLEITDRLRKEMTEIFSGMNIFQEEN
jgi:S-adenosylmethionine decarboxylase